MTLGRPQCLECKHMLAKGCTAFPDQIPVEILVNGRNHNKPFPGDHGILFKQK